MRSQYYYFALLKIRGGRVRATKKLQDLFAKTLINLFLFNCLKEFFVRADVVRHAKVKEIISFNKF